MSDTKPANDHNATEELRVSFIPELYLQRRGWVFKIMRRERVTQVLDIGCGEGELIACLCNPAPWLPLRSAAYSYSNENCPHHEAVRVEESINEKDDFLHVRRIAALDICPEDLEQATHVTKPMISSSRVDGGLRGAMRWESLEVKVWQGGLESYNPEFVGVECIVSTEVIEHLPEDILPHFAPMLLGVYHPRLLLITTPSYTFNARFTAPDAPECTRQGYRDPTGRTNRIFRHSDHKFEWTVEEFTQWCEDAAKQWGYEVDVSGVGVAREEDPWGRDEELGKASQVASFRRIEGKDLVRIREEQCKAVGVLNRAIHELLVTHQHRPSQDIQEARSLGEIGQLVCQTMQAYQKQTIFIHELWTECEIMCGGWLQNLIAAVIETDGLQLHREDGKSSGDWVVEFEGFVPRAVEEIAETSPQILAHECESDEDPISWPVAEEWGQSVDDSITFGWEGTWEPPDTDSWKDWQWNETAMTVS